MPVPTEICVLFPCHTLEDFPTHLRDGDAGGLLAAWTAAWHPRVLANVEQIPSWHRADTPPIELDQRVLLIPAAAQSRLPSDLEQRVGDADSCVSLEVTDIESTASQLISLCEHAADEPEADGSGRVDSSESATLQAEEASRLTVEDFYALGYAALQIQVMTRRLRYSSNLDLITFSEHAVSAAKAWRDGQEDAACEALQAAFDLLGEERDHYFTGDPHLIDVVLVADSTLGPALAATLQEPQPLNLLMSGETAERIATEFPEIAARIRERLAEKSLCIAGGAPNDDESLDLLSCSEIQDWLRRGLNQTEQALAAAPRVFGRIGGGIPGDLVPWLVGASMVGAITNDFASGVGSQGEPKMIWQSGGAEIEALTAKPLQTTQPQSFLAIGSKLGEASDSGQVAACLFARWPGESSPWLSCMRRASHFTPALGHFWLLEDFFVNGERPYHGCTLQAARGDGEALRRRVEAPSGNALSSVASQFHKGLKQDAAKTCWTLASAVAGEPLAPDEQELAHPHAVTLAATELSRRLGYSVPSTPRTNAASSTEIASNAAIVINPHCGAGRAQFELAGAKPTKNTPGLYGASQRGRSTCVTIDVPGNGFASCKAGGNDAPENANDGGSFWKFWQRKKPLAHGQALANEFLDVAIHPETGAIAAVHAGQQRGNRFSWQLAVYDKQASDGGYSKMVCDRVRTIESDLSRGVIQVDGHLQTEGRKIAEFTNRYIVWRGSRWLDIEIEVNASIAFKADPWQHYLAGRAAWSSNALSIRPLVRDKRHRTTGRFLEAPLGVEVDEGERKLLICSHGYPSHRRLGDERLDTLLMVRGEGARSFRLSYGFDVPAAVRSMRLHQCPPETVPLEQLHEDATRGWLADVSSNRVQAVDWEFASDGAVLVTLIETTGRSVKTRVRLFRDITEAAVEPVGTAVNVEDGAAMLHLAGHEVVRVRLQLANA